MALVLVNSNNPAFKLLKGSIISNNLIATKN